VGVESLGLVQAMNDPRTSFLQGLHVMLDAELIDNTGWEMLIELARSAGHEDIAARFGTAAQQEAVHLRTIKTLVGRLTLADAGVADALM
jgi:rubrerythrin